MRNYIKRVLDREPVIYTWQKIQVGPNYTVERIKVGALTRYEVQSKGGAHIGHYHDVETAIAAVMSIDDMVVIPQDLEEIK